MASAELMGILFKTHKQFVGNLVQVLRNKVLPEAFASKEQKREKFALFILDDFVEHLGPNYFDAADFTQICQGICSFANRQSAALRQASAYGIGVIGENAGQHFASVAELCLSSLKQACEFPMTPKV